MDSTEIIVNDSNIAQKSVRSFGGSRANNNDFQLYWNEASAVCSLAKAPCWYLTFTWAGICALCQMTITSNAMQCNAMEFRMEQMKLLWMEYIDGPFFGALSPSFDAFSFERIWFLPLLCLPHQMFSGLRMWCGFMHMRVCQRSN